MDPVLFYHQASGLLQTPQGQFVALGWAGNHAGKNNPSMESVHDIGPLPRGLYRVGPWEDQHPGLGPLVAHLEQVQGDSFGRSGFYFHGPSMDPAHMGQESKGCIVVQHASREKVKQAAPDGSYVQVFA